MEFVTLNLSVNAVATLKSSTTTKKAENVSKSLLVDVTEVDGMVLKHYQTASKHALVSMLYTKSASSPIFQQMILCWKAVAVGSWKIENIENKVWCIKIARILKIVVQTGANLAA